MLSAERNTNNRDAQQQPEKQVSQADPEASDEDPDHVHDQAQATARIAVVRHPAAERPKSQHPQLQCLQPERDTDYRNHQQQAGYQIFHRGKQSAADKPDDISQNFIASIL